MAKNQTGNCPVTDLFRTWQDSMRKQIFKAFSSEFITFSSGHSMLRIIAFIAFITGEYIQICSIQLNSLFFQLRKVSFHIIRCLCRTQIRLRTACPSLMLRNGSIRKPACIIFIKTWSSQIIVSVLIMNPKQITAIMHGICQ